MIDTLRFARHMQAKGGMTKEAAEALAEGINDAALEQLATKQDLELLEGRLSNKLYAVAFGIVLATGVLSHVWK
jgi:hypothetical protein